MHNASLPGFFLIADYLIDGMKHVDTGLNSLLNI